MVKTMSLISSMNYVQRHRCCFLRHQGLEEEAFSTHAVSPFAGTHYHDIAIQPVLEAYL